MPTGTKRFALFTLRSLLSMSAAMLLCFGAATGCHNTSGNDVAAKLTGSTKKVDGEPCAKDSECVNVCLTAAEAEKTPTLQPNTCGKSDRVNPN